MKDETIITYHDSLRKLSKYMPIEEAEKLIRKMLKDNLETYLKTIEFYVEFDASTLNVRTQCVGRSGILTRRNTEVCPNR